MDTIPEQVTRYTDQSVSTIHHTLRAPRRRVTIILVAHRMIALHQSDAHRLNGLLDSEGREPAVTVRRLARELVSIEQNIAIEHATGDTYHNVYTSLIQTHLPKLHSVDAINYDSDRKHVRPGRNLLALAVAATITSPIAQLLFYDGAADLYTSGRSSPHDSIDD